MSSAAAAPGTADEATLPYSVETFDYPNAAKILKERGIALRKGDGHIVLAKDCNVTQDIAILTSDVGNPDRGRYCFKVTGTGKTGYLTLEIPKVLVIKTADYHVQASVTADGTTTSVDVPKNQKASVGEGTNPPGGPAVLVELRVTG
ncbi:hypothetical protein [Streptomyces chrestomyceticus]|uniref:hypothetical protein n=1 Tax=Streptomyces chrestomyceticus TaxID=68185 RepID=UPI0035A8D445